MIMNLEVLMTKQTTPAVFNPDDYKEDLKEFDLTDEQAEEILRTLWEMMTMMVDLGWGVDTVNIVLPDLFIKTCNSDED